jgi:hypothetical protein
MARPDYSLSKLAPGLSRTTQLSWAQRPSYPARFSGGRVWVTLSQPLRSMSHTRAPRCGLQSYFAGSCGGAPIALIRQYMGQQQTIEQQQTPH